MKILSLVLIAAIAIGLTTGCGEEPKDPLKPEITQTDTIGTVGKIKQPEAAMAAPQAPGVGTPFVKEVGFYIDWRLTKPVKGMVPPGTTIYTEVVFSEAMHHIAADDTSARPVLYYQVDRKRTRYRVAQHWAGKGDFISGDAKPKGRGATAFICRYTVQEEDEGSFTLAVGKLSADQEGNRLSAFYTHKERIRLGKEKPVIVEMVEPEPTTEPEIPAKPHRIRPGTRAFTGQVFFPITDIAKATPRGSVRNATETVSGVTVTIASGPYYGESVTTDSAGRYTFHTNKDELHLLVWKEGFEPKEVIVHRSQPTKLANGIVPNFRGDPQKTPSNILIGHRWPDEVRFILRQTVLVHDLLYADSKSTPSERIGGFYSGGVVVVYSEYIRSFGLGTAYVIGSVAHEVAHAYQHAVVTIDGSGDFRDWTETPEGRAFIKAKQRDWEEHGKARYDTVPGLSSDYENAAEMIAYFWSIGRWERKWHRGLETDAPNRLKWAEEWLTKR